MSAWHTLLSMIRGIIASPAEQNASDSMRWWVGAGNKAAALRVSSDSPEDLVFQSVKDGRPIRDNNVLTRYLKPAGRALGMPWVNWRCLRTSHATWLKLAGADVKDAQAQMRHSRASTTLDIYQQFVPESQRRAVDKLTELSLAGGRIQ